MQNDWSGRHVLVTGGTRGIGLETGLAFARMGARPILTWCWGGEEEAAARFSAEGLPLPRFERADAGSAADADALFARLKGEIDRIDAFVSNVSVAGTVRGVGDYKLKALQRSIEVTAWPIVAYTQAIHATFGAWPRYVVGVSSFGTRRFALNYDFVAASKGVLEALVPYLAHRLRPDGVRVNAVSCGLARTASSTAMAGDRFSDFEAWHEANLGPVPYVRPEAVAAAIFGLCSGWMDGVSGQILPVDDGSALFADSPFALYSASHP